MDAVRGKIEEQTETYSEYGEGAPQILTKKCAEIGSPRIHMNKQGIVDAVQAILNGTKVQAEQAVDCVVNTIIDSLKKGEEVSIAGLGIFATKTRAARQARNPRTGEAISVPAMRVPKFRAAKALKDAVK